MKEKRAEKEGGEKPSSRRMLAPNPSSAKSFKRWERTQLPQVYFFHCKFIIFLCYDDPNFKRNTNSTCELGCKFFCTVAKLIFFLRKKKKQKTK